MGRQRYAIIGFPLKHSFSPIIHNRAFKDLNIDAQYEKIEINPDQFEQQIEFLKKTDLAGLNVTIPFKERILLFVDSLSEEVREIGAVNTIKYLRGQWHGFNTDWLGFLKPLKGQMENIKSCLLLGAGGAARGVFYAFLQFPELQTVFVVNRTEEKAQMLVESFSLKKRLNIVVVNFNSLREHQEKFDLIVNTTSVGMSGHPPGPLIDPAKWAHAKTVVYDLVYNPLKTPLLIKAEEQNLKTINGLPMLIYQAEAACKIWTGCNYSQQTFEFLFKTLSGKVES